MPTHTVKKLDLPPHTRPWYGMQIIIHQWAFDGSFEQLEQLPRQELVNDWYGFDIEPPALFSFATDGTYLWFLASRNTKALSHPDGHCGIFQSELWKYDVAEWFIAPNNGTNYIEFNLAPSGAWWSCAFSDVRQADEKAIRPKNVSIKQHSDDGSWLAMAKIPLSELGDINIRDCKIATTFILNSPEQIFTTSTINLCGEPDFHRPEDFSSPIMK